MRNTKMLPYHATLDIDDAIVVYDGNGNGMTLTFYAEQTSTFIKFKHDKPRNSDIFMIGDTFTLWTRKIFLRCFDELDIWDN
jgi:hypothetical protein